jgi:hypothetical protein
MVGHLRGVALKHATRDLEEQIGLRLSSPRPEARHRPRHHAVQAPAYDAPRVDVRRPRPPRQQIRRHLRRPPADELHRPRPAPQTGSTGSMAAANQALGHLQALTAPPMLVPRPARRVIGPRRSVGDSSTHTEGGPGAEPLREPRL